MAKSTLREADRDILELEKDASGGDGTQDQEGARTQSKLPKPPGEGRALTREELESYVLALTARDWAHCCVYVYQWWPVQMERPHGENYIVKFNEPFNLENFLDVYGSGDWRFVLNDTDLKRKKQTVCTCLLKVRDPERPPKVNVATLAVNDPLNRDLVQQLIRDGKLMQSANGDVVIPPVVQPTQTDPTGQMLAREFINIIREERSGGGRGRTDAMSEAIKIMSTASQESIKFALAQVNTQAPDAIFGLLIKLKDFFQPAKPAEGEGGGMIAFIMQEMKGLREELKAEREQNHKLQLKMLETHAPEKRSTIGALFTEFEAFGKLRTLLSSGDGAPKDWKEMGMQILNSSSEGINDLLSAFAGRLRAGPTATQPAATPTTPAARQVTGPASNGAPATPAAASAQDPAAAEPATTQAGQLQELQKILIDFGGHFIQAFKAGVPGSQFAEGIESVYGKPQYDRLANYGKELWLMAIQSIPECMNNFRGLEPQLAEFLDDFIAYGQPLPEDQPSTPEETTTTPGGKKRKGATAAK